MAWISFYSPTSTRLSSLPPLLAGPIIRRAEANNVSIWFVLKENKPNVRLKIYSSKSGSSLVMEGSQASGVALGDHVYVYCVTATPIGASLTVGTNYYYDIEFGAFSLSALIAGDLSFLTYDGSHRPSFSLPPDNLDQVRLIHGSCRKPHGEGYDAMEGVHDMILSSVFDTDTGRAIDPIQRPHQLFLTGDQIYADDVADVLLFMIDDAASTLFDWDEDEYNTHFTDAGLAPGKRNTNNNIRNLIGFTGMLPNKPQYSKSHLLKFREYACMYLFVWSDVLWPVLSDFPDFQNVYPGESEYDEVVHRPGGGGGVIHTNPYFTSQKEEVIKFSTTIKKIRKALANIPTYMIFDDHEITDDWNLNWRWCKEVYSKPLGRRTVQNGLLAYALFQAWGNTPEQFIQRPKDQLLDAANNWRGDNDSNFLSIKGLLNVPTILSNAAISNFPHSTTDFFDWHYNIDFNHYAIYIQDSRTWRGYPSGQNDIAFAKLITQQGHNHQLPATFPIKEIILIIAPSPVDGLPLIESVQHDETTWEDRCGSDTEAWSLDQDGYERLFSNLSSRLPITGTGSERRRNGRFALLSGDVHYGMSARHQIWGSNFLNDLHTDVYTRAVFSQLTASSFKNQTSSGSGPLGLFGTVSMHSTGYRVGLDALPSPHQVYVWDLLTRTEIGQQGRVAHRVPFTLPAGLNVMSFEQLHENFIHLSGDPHWKHRIDFILGLNSGNNSRVNVTPRQVSTPHVSLDDYLRLANDHGIGYVGRWGDGKEIVGLNNLGEIRFEMSEQVKKIHHILWWRMESGVSGISSLQLFPLTTFSIPINFTGDRTFEGNPINLPIYNNL